MKWVAWTRLGLLSAFVAIGAFAPLSCRGNVQNRKSSASTAFPPPGTLDDRLPPGAKIYQAPDTLPPADKAQEPPGVQWTDTFKSKGTSFGNALVQVADGGVVAVGRRYDAAGAVPYIVKVDQYGKLRWDRQLLGPDTVGEATSVLSTEAGNFVVVGSSRWSDGNLGSTWLAKLDAQGHAIWRRIIDDTGDIRGCSVVRGADGGFCVAGLSIWSDSGLVLIKTDSLGGRQWTKCYASSYDCCEGEHRMSVGLLPTHDNGYVLSSKVLLKVDSAGRQQWMTALAGLHRGLSVAQASDGGYAVIGSLGYDMCLTKTDSKGIPIWRRLYTRNRRGYAEGYSVELMPDGGFLLAGHDYYEILVVRTDSRGDVLWRNRLGESEADCIRPARDGGYVMTGMLFDKKANNDFMYVMKLTPDRN